MRSSDINFDLFCLKSRDNIRKTIFSVTISNSSYFLSFDQNKHIITIQEKSNTSFSVSGGTSSFNLDNPQPLYCCEASLSEEMTNVIETHLAADPPSYYK